MVATLIAAIRFLLRPDTTPLQKLTREMLQTDFSIEMTFGQKIYTVLLIEKALVPDLIKSIHWQVTFGDVVKGSFCGMPILTDRYK